MPNSAFVKCFNRNIVNRLIQLKEFPLQLHALQVITLIPAVFLDIYFISYFSETSPILIKYPQTRIGIPLPSDSLAK